MAKFILAVDDEQDIRIILQSLLESRGYRVELACDGAEGLAKIKEKNYDLVILDIMMPELDGFQVLREVRTHKGAELPIIMLTAKASEKDVWKGYEEGATYYMTKPFNNQTLLNIIDYLIGDLSPEESIEIEKAL